MQMSLGTPSHRIGSGIAGAVVTGTRNASCSFSLPETADMSPFRSWKKRDSIINSRGRRIVGSDTTLTFDTSLRKQNTLGGPASKARLGMYRTNEPSSTTRATPVSGST